MQPQINLLPKEVRLPRDCELEEKKGIVLNSMSYTGNMLALKGFKRVVDEIVVPFEFANEHTDHLLCIVSVPKKKKGLNKSPMISFW